MKLQEVKHPGARLQLNDWSPRQSIAAGIILAFLVFVALDSLEVLFFANAETWLRIVHFIRGIISTSGGMLFVWAVMQKKEVELTALRDHFADQLTERTKQLQSKIEDNERQNKCLIQQREDFLAVIRHRLRTPVLANRRTAQLMLDGTFGPLLAQQRDVMNALLSNNDDIDRVLEMLMDIYRYKNDSNPLNLTYLSLQEIIPDLTNLKLRAAKKSINIDAAIDRTIMANFDRDKMQQLTTHLIENAIKYARSSVKITARQHSEDELEIYIADDGPGIPASDLETLFDRFYLVSGGGKYSAITGAGLCLCAEIAKAHKGQILCESTSELGTKFRVLLPSQLH